MNSKQPPSGSFTMIPQVDVVFERKAVYLTGQSFIQCAFRSCTLIIKDTSALGTFKDCRFDNCVWHLNMTVSDGQFWQTFLKDIAPAISATLPSTSPDVPGMSSRPKP